MLHRWGDIWHDSSTQDITFIGARVEEWGPQKTENFSHSRGIGILKIDIDNSATFISVLFCKSVIALILQVF